MGAPSSGDGGTHARAHIRRALSSSLEAMGGAWASDELAYLAVTSKVELPFRDRFAWLVHRELSPDLVVAREWRRADLAVLEGTACLAQVEAKALYSFDVLSHVNRQAYVHRLLADAAKMAALAPGSDRYLLALVTDVAGDIPSALRKHVVKYSAGILKAARGADDGDTRTPSCGLWSAEMEAFGATVQHQALGGGSVWGLAVTVDAYLVGPLPAVSSSLPARTPATEDM